MTNIITTSIELRQNEYYHKITLEVNQFSDYKVGQIIGKLAQRFYYALGMAKLNGCGKGIDLRKPFDITIKSNNIVLFDTLTITEEEQKARITVGLTKRGQKRFGLLLARSFHGGFQTLTEEEVFDIMDERNTQDEEKIMQRVRTLLDMPFVDIADLNPKELQG